MLLPIRVIYEGQHVTYDMQVGDGRMTVKWLSLAIAQRFAGMVKPRGHRRYREKPGLGQILSTSASLIPSRVYTNERSFVHPDKALREELQDGEEVCVVLTKKMCGFRHDRIRLRVEGKMTFERKLLRRQKRSRWREIEGLKWNFHPRNRSRGRRRNIHRWARYGGGEVATAARPVDKIGEPQRDRWAFVAFASSSGGRSLEERTKAIDAEYRLMAETKEQQQQEEERRAADLAAKKGNQMRRVMLSQLYSAEKVERAFEEDWARLCHPILQPLDKIVADPEEQSRVKDAVLKHYIALVEIFKNYASVGSAHATAELDLMEFSAFMHDLRGFSQAKSRDVVEKTFTEAVTACKGDRGKPLAGTGVGMGTMGVPEFIFSGLRLACVKHQTSTGLYHGAAGGGGDLGMSSSRAKTVTSVHEAVLMFMDGVIVPLAQRKVIGLQIKKALESDDILALYHDNDTRLKMVFDRYSSADVRNGAHVILGVLLNITEFGMVLRDAGLLGGNNKEDDELTVKEARQAFAGAQNDLCGGDDYVPPSLAEIGSAVEQMTYPEFLEGVARVAVLKWEDVSMPLQEKIRRALEAVTGLLDKK